MPKIAMLIKRDIFMIFSFLFLFIVFIMFGQPSHLVQVLAFFHDAKIQPFFQEKPYFFP